MTFPNFNGRKTGAWKKDPYTFKQHRCIVNIYEAGLICESEMQQIALEINAGIMTKGRASEVLDKYLPLYRKLKKEEAEGCKITDPVRIQEIQDQLLAEQQERKERIARRKARGSCIKE